MLSTSYSQRQEMRRFRHRTLSGLDSSSSGVAAGMMGLGRTGSALGHHQVQGGRGDVGAALDHFLQQRPSSAIGLRPITPSSNYGGVAGDKDGSQGFVDFNPAGEEFYYNNI